MRRFYLFIVFVPLYFATCSSPVASEPEERNMTRREQQRKGMRASTWRFVYCVDEAQEGEKLSALLHEIAAAQPFGKRIEVWNCNEVSTDSLAVGPVSVFGSKLPVGSGPLITNSNQQGSTIFDSNKEISQGDVVLVPYTDNPWNKGKTIAGFYYSKDLDRLEEVLRADNAGSWDRLFWAEWAFEIHRVNGDRLYGSYKDTTWIFDSEAEVAMEQPDRPIYDDGEIVIFAYDGQVKAAEKQEVTAALKFAQRSMQATYGANCGEMPEVRLYPSLERIGLRTQTMNPAQYDRRKNVLHIFPGYFRRGELDFEMALWQPFLQQCIEEGTTRENQLALVAFAQEQATKSQLQSADYKKLLASSLRLTTTNLDQLLVSHDENTVSYPIRTSLARVQVQCLGGTTGAALLDQLKSETAEQLPIVREMVRMKARNLPPLERTASPTQHLNGMTFAHQGYRVHNGYGGSKAGPSLDSLGKLHVNALAVVPYTFQRDPAKAAPFYLPKDAGSENDFATVHSLRLARDRGWFNLLKPQIWLSGGSWPGDVGFDSEEEWADWFRHYHYWILHYAILAEAEGVDALCLGTELGKTTLQQPERWKAIIADVRKVYSGQLTYAANWGEEFEQLSFWESLDAIGLNSYYPLSKGDNPTDEELLAGAREWLDLAAEISRSAGKPLWLTEIGYRSVDRPWQNPHASANGRPFNGEAQRRCFDAFFTAAAETPELKGIFFWKWPSWLAYREGRNRPATDFTPGGKPAASEVSQYYGKR